MIENFNVRRGDCTRRQMFGVTRDDRCLENIAVYSSAGLGLTLIFIVRTHFYFI